MFFHYKILRLTLAALLCVGYGVGHGVIAQPGQLDFRNFGVKDGLPSSEVYTIFEDRKGFIWVGTDNGVARFDGYEFEVFDAKKGLNDVVVFAILDDDDGNIWVSTYSGQIFYFENERFHAYEHNRTLKSLRRNQDQLFILDVLPNRELVVKIRQFGISKIDSTGTLRLMSHGEDRNRMEAYVYSTPEAKEESWQVRNHNLYAYQKQEKEAGEAMVVYHEGLPAWEKLLTRNFLKTDDLNVYASAGLFYSGKRMLAYFVGQTTTYIYNTEGETINEFPYGARTIRYVMNGFEPNSYLLFGDRGTGLQLCTPDEEDTDDYVIKSFLNNHSLSAGIYDRRGGLWVASLDAGLFYCPYPEQTVYQVVEDKTIKKPITIALAGDGDFYAGYDDGDLFRYNAASNRIFNVWNKEIKHDTRQHDVYFDDDLQRLFFKDGSFYHSPRSESWLTDELYVPLVVGDRDLNAYRYSLFPQTTPGVIYIAGYHYLAKIVPDESLRVKYFWAGNTKTAQVQDYGVTTDGKEIIGTIHGLAAIEEDEVVPFETGVDVLSTERIVAMVATEKDNRLFATRGVGIVYHSNDTTYYIQEKDGLASNRIRHLHHVGANDYYVSTLDGVSHLRLSEGERCFQIRTFTTGHGLPDNEVQQVDTDGEDVWLATGTGIVHFIPPAIDTLSPSPHIRSLQVDGQEVPWATELNLRPGRHDLSITYGSINFVLNGKVRYRYRINEQAGWSYTYNRTAAFPNLPSGNYLFTVQGENQDGIWSEPVTVSINIATPWYLTWWALVGLMLLVAGIISLIFLIRERRQRREQALLTQINQLEHAALHAQMNPHFVFNALNSIQNFVLKNDARQAATYLSRFASIIRQTLRSSVNGRHSLKAELEMLSTYLVLEKLRFKAGFTYSIEVAEQLDQEAISMPPLLIQPFVENAILHGLKGKKDEGRIAVRFGGSAQELTIIIEDNGQGYDPNKDAGRESMGMDITRKRLTMMNGDKDNDPVLEVEKLYHNNGAVAGTRITLLIRLKPVIPINTK